MKNLKTFITLFVLYGSVTLIECTSTRLAIEYNTREKLYYYINNEYKEIFSATNEFFRIRTLYYLGADGKTKHEIDRSDPNIFTESQKWEREQQGSLRLSVNPREIYEERTNNVFQIVVEYNLIADEAILMIVLTAGNLQQTIETKHVSHGKDTIRYNATAIIEIYSPCFIEAYFKQKEGNKTFAYNKQNITVKEPRYMSEPIPDARTMQMVLTQTAANATRQAESDFSKWRDIAEYLDFRTLLTTISADSFITIGSYSLQLIFASIYPLQLSNECNGIIEDWQYVSRRQFENAVFIQTYMETVNRLQRRSRY
jgi:hypothetical protein